MASSKVLCAGIVVADHVSTPIDHLPAAGELVRADDLILTIGGCASNVAVDLARMNVDATVVGRVGEDVFGRVVTELLQEQGVDVSGLKVTSDVGTSQTLIVNVKGEDRRFIHSFGANAHFTADDIPLSLIQSAEILYVGGYLVMPALTQEALANVFAQAKQFNVQTILDVVVPGPGGHLSQLEKLLPHVDYFLPNNDEAKLILDESDPLNQARAFRGLGVGTCIVTLGSDGAIVVSEQESLRCDAFDVDYVDGSGGGDAFSAGLMAGLIKGLDLREALRWASALGASCVRSIGTTTGVFRRKEHEHFLNAHSTWSTRSI